MSSPADEISKLVPNTVLEGATGWNIRIGKMPDKPDLMVVFYDTGGQSPMPTFRLDFRSVMCMVRAGPNDYLTAYTKAQEIKDSLLGIPSQDLPSGDRLDGITMIGDINLVNYDDAQRPQLSLNFRVFWEPATNALSHRE